jgi:hypothetical protein
MIRASHVGMPARTGLNQSRTSYEVVTAAAGASRDERAAPLSVLDACSVRDGRRARHPRQCCSCGRAACQAAGVSIAGAKGAAQVLLAVTRRRFRTGRRAVGSFAPRPVSFLQYRAELASADPLVCESQLALGRLYGWFLAIDA